MHFPLILRLYLSTCVWTCLFGLGTASPLQTAGRALLALAANCDVDSMIPGAELKDCAKNQPLDNGNCIGSIPDQPGDSGCTAYCENSITFYFGEEQPYPNAGCETNTPCSWTEGKTITKTRTWTTSVEVGGGFDPADTGLKSSFSIGGSYAYSESYSLTSTLISGRPTGENRSGYWTFVPYMVKSCGTITAAAKKATTRGPTCTTLNCSGEVVDICDKDELKTGPLCQSTYIIADGKPVGMTLFVATCNGNLPCREGQDRKYYWNGVSTDETFPKDLYDKPEIAKWRA